MGFLIFVKRFLSLKVFLEKLFMGKACVIIFEIIQVQNCEEIEGEIGCLALLHLRAPSIASVDRGARDES